MPRLSSKNQITVPVDVLRQIGMKPGDEVVVRPRGLGRFEVELAEDFITRFAGAMPAGTYPPGAARSLRREWQR
jgi:bifunctional DNA-binding transcriptional regulator/antitoxin component of YhaV-PrlF toxin-antitoxin module